MQAMPKTPILAVAALASGAVLAILPTSATAAQPSEATRTVASWVDDHAVPIRDLSRPGPDLDVLGQATRNAQIVGLGESGHALEELTGLKRRAVEFLIEERGFRSLAWEDDWTLGVQINDYLHGHRDDRDALVGRMSTGHRTEEVADLLSWLREYNETHRDDVQFVGVEYFTTRPLAYDAVQTYVAEQAPDLIDELTPHLELTRPESDDMKAHLTWYFEEVDDKGPYVRSAEEVYRIVESVPHEAGEREHELALQHARQIRSWYTAFAQPLDEIPAYRDARAAENLRWWHEYSGDKVIYWAATAHTADAPDLTITFPGHGETTFASVGSFIDDWYGDRYVKVGYTFDHGTIGNDQGEVIEMPPAQAEWFEAPLGDVPRSRYVIDLDRRVPPQVRDWLEAPMLTRGDPASGVDSTATGSTPEDWYDVLVHSQEVGPATPLN
jgi:erythromycin esterase